MNKIEYDKIIENYKTMINLLEFDSMRSPGKAKLNSQHLHAMYWLVAKYEEKIKPAKKDK